MQFLYGNFCVALEEEGVGIREERVRDAGIAGFRVVAAHDALRRVAQVQNGHAVDRRAFRRVRGGVRDVICADRDGNVTGSKFRVDVLQHVKVFIIHVGFAEQYAHVAGHTPGDRMDGKFDVRAPGFQGAGKVCNVCLSLGERHAVTGHENDLLRLSEELCGLLFGKCTDGGSRFFAGGLVFNGRVLLFGFRLSRFAFRDRIGRGFLLRLRNSGRAGQDRGKLPVHGLAHVLREEEARRADDAADTDEKRITDRHARDTARDARKRIQKRDRDRHVCAAHAHDEEYAEEECKNAEHDVERRMHKKPQDERGRHQDSHHERQGRMARKALRGGLQNAGELSCRDEGAGQRDRTDHDREAGGHIFKCQTCSLRSFRGLDQRCHCDKGRRRAAEAVQESDRLGHFDHLRADGPDDADDRAETQRDVDRKHFPGLKIAYRDEYDRENRRAERKEVAEQRGFHLALEDKARKDH